jgi:ubiquinone/menaquinone biosynthesis C-methylase UbiE
MQPYEDQIIAGQAVYTHRILSVYDILVLGFSNRYIWKCPSPNIEAHYNIHLSSNHLEVGVGTGYFLNRCKFTSDSPRIVLMDMNPETLAFASNRIARYKPETYLQNILEKIKTPMEPFDSVGFNYLFHCLPGAISENAVALDHLKRVMNPGAQIFGSTILHDGVPVGWTAEKLMSLYNKKGIFSNLEDDLEGLNSSLSQRFANVSIEVIGCVGLFSGTVH